MSEENGWLGRRLAVAGATILTAGAVACGGAAWASEVADTSGDASQQAQAADAQGAGGTQVTDASEVAALASTTSSNPPADVPEGENPRPGMDSVGAPEKRPGAQEGEELAPAVKVAPECDPDGESLTLWVWAASMNVDPEITLRQLNAWRTQAAQNGITDEQGEVVTGEALTWSDSLAYAAQEIAVEIALGGGDISVLDRLDGSGSVNAGEGNTFFKKTNIVGASVRTSLTSVQGALDEWYVQSDNYWAGNTSVAGDYAAAISNKARSVGMAAVMLSNEEVYIVCLYGDAVPEEVGDTTYELTTGSAIYQGVNVRRDYLTLVLDVPDTCTAGQEVTLGLRASTSLAGNAVSKDMGVAIDSQAIFDEATIQVVQDGQVVGEVRKGVLQAEDGFASGEATVEVVVGGSVLAQAQATLQAVPENVAAEASFDVSVASGGAVELPQTAEVVWSGGSVSDEPVTWDALTDEQAAVVASREGGTFEVEGVVEATGESVSSTVTVEPATMVSAEVPGVDAVWVGSTPVLPETLAVTWSNGDVTDEAVTWQMPDTSQPGCVQAVGAVEGLGQEVLADVEVRALEVAGIDESGLTAVQVESGTGASDVAASLPGSVFVSWSDGSVTDEPVTWDALSAEQEGALASREGGQLELYGAVGQTGQTVSVEIVVAPAVAVSAEAPAAQEIWVGGTPDLPQTVQVTWSNGDVTDEAVEWTVPEDAFAQAGTVVLQGGVACLPDSPVELSVSVRALEVADVDDSQLAQVDAASGADASSALAALPGSVPVTWSDGSVTDEAVTWDALTAEQEGVLASREGGRFELQGAVGQTGRTVSVEVVVAPAVAVSVEAPAAQEVWQGGKVELPTEVAVTWSNGDVTQQAVTWGDVDTSAPGTYEVQGSVEGCDQAVSATVEVKALEAGEVNGSASVEASVPAGASASEALAALPQTVPVTWSDGSVTDEPVAWDALSAEQEDVLVSREGGTVEVQGAVGDTGKTVSATVEVKAAQVTSVEAPAAQEVWQGGKVELPTEVAVTWSNGDVTQQAVTWGDVDTSAPGTYEVQGSVEGCDQAVSATVEVKALEAGEVNGSVAVEASVPAGASASEALAALPQTVPVTWSDGSVTDEPVAWDALSSEQEDVLSSREGGAVEVQGAVGDTGQTVSATVEVTPAQVESVEDPQPLSVESGSDPELPAEVAVTWSNGDVTDEAVTWDALTAEQESTLSSRKGGTVSVQGSVEAADTTVTATVDVQPAQVVQIEDIKPVSVEVGEVAKLPSQVSVTWSNGDVTIEPVTWEDVDTSKAGSYEVKGTLSEGDTAVSATVQVASDGQAATTPASGDATAAGTTPASESAETPAASESSSKPAASSWTGTPASSTAATSESSDAQHADGLPGWLIATIAGIGAALVAAGAFIVGKRSSSHDDDEPAGKHAAK